MFETDPITELKQQIRQAEKEKADLEIQETFEKKQDFAVQKKDILLETNSEPVSQNGIKAVGAAIVFWAVVLAIR